MQFLNYLTKEKEGIVFQTSTLTSFETFILKFVFRLIMNPFENYLEFETQFIEFLKTNLKRYLTIKKQKTKIVLKLINKKSRSSYLTIKFLEDVFTQIKTKQIADETILYDKNNYEILVQRNVVMGPMFMSFDEKQFEKEDKINNLSYDLSKPSIEYLLFLFINSVESKEIILRRFRLEEDIENIISKNKKDGELITELGLIIPRTMTLRISSKEERTLSFFEDISDSFLFSIAYNSKRSFLKVKNIMNDSENRELRRMQMRRRRTIDEIEAPKRTYIRDLLSHYQMAIAVRIPCQQYLSFFHILEHNLLE